MSRLEFSRRNFLAGAATLPVAAAFASRALSSSTPGRSPGAGPLIPNSTDLNVAMMETSVDSNGVALSEVAQRSGRYFGAAVRSDQLEANPQLRELVIRDCTSLTPEIHLYWNCLEWNKGRYNFKPVDELLTFAAAHDMTVRGHALIWDPCTPDWAKAEMLRKRDWRLIERHFSNVLGRYRNDIEDWNVVNEPIDTVDGENDLRRTSFQRAFGPDYVARALRDARAIAPRARLLINEYGFDYANPVDAARRQAFLKLIRDLKQRDVPLDGVGIQAHLDLSKGPLAERELKIFFRELAATGVDITISELDVKEQGHHLPLAERDRLVAEEARKFLDIALGETSVRGVVTWGISDRHSWLTENPTQATLDARGRPVLNRGLPYDQNYQQKLMHSAIHDSLGHSAKQGIAFKEPTEFDRIAAGLS